MKIFGFGKERAIPFGDFCDVVRQTVRRAFPGATMDRTENGFILTIEGKPITCHLRSLYASYHKAPGHREKLIKSWMDALATPVPEMTWVEAALTLRPQLKESAFLNQAAIGLAKQADSLPATPFVGDLSTVVVRDLGGIIAFVTQSEIERWQIPFERAAAESLNNMNLLNFPPITNSLYSGGSMGKHTPKGDVVGLVFEGDYLTASWLLAERFRDYLVQRLQGDCIVSVPHRSRLVAIRSDEPGLINSILQANRSFLNDTHALTSQCYHVSGAAIGGVVTLWQPGISSLGATSYVAPPRPPTPAPSGQPAYARPAPVDFSAWGGLMESTGAPPTSGANDSKPRR